jgi:hypothetical protein
VRPRAGCAGRAAARGRPRGRDRRDRRRPVARLRLGARTAVRAAPDRRGADRAARDRPLCVGSGRSAGSGKLPTARPVRGARPGTAQQGRAATRPRRNRGDDLAPLLRRIHEVSGGNPLYAIELARAVAADEQAGRSSARPTAPRVAPGGDRSPARHGPRRARALARDGLCARPGAGQGAARGHTRARRRRTRSRGPARPPRGGGRPRGAVLAPAQLQPGRLESRARGHAQPRGRAELGAALERRRALRGAGLGSAPRPPP